MRIASIFAAIFCVFVPLCASSAVIEPPPRSISPESSSECFACRYDDYLDAVFPREFRTHGAQTGVALRYMPFEQPEVQINLLFRSRSDVEVTVYRAKSSIELQLEALEDSHPTLTFSQVVGKLQVGISKATLSQKNRFQLFNQIKNAIAKTVLEDAMPIRPTTDSVEIPMDMPAYSLFYVGRHTALSLKAFAPAPIVRRTKEAPAFVEIIDRLISELRLNSVQSIKTWKTGVRPSIPRNSKPLDQFRR